MEAIMATARQMTARSSLKINKIAVLIDFSKNANTALQYVTVFAREYGASIVLAHAYVLPTSAYAAPKVGLVYQAFEDFRGSLEHRLLDKTEATYLRGLRCSVLLHEGAPVELFEYLNDVDLIVVGTSGETGLAKAALGSTAETVFRSSAAPVLTVGPGCHFTRTRKIAAGSVLYATDLSDGAAIAAPYALSIAQKHDAELMLLHVVEDKEVVFSFERTMASAGPLERLHSLLPADAELRHAPQYIVGFGAPDAVILEEAKKHNVELIVLDARREGSFTSAVYRFGGGTAY
jgi:nucleotide-binding universal stress UspA family protein